jgi:hypothetical protein
MEEEKKGKLLKLRLGTKRLRDELSAAFVDMANYKCCLSLCADFMLIAAEARDAHDHDAAGDSATKRKKR